MAPNYRGGKTKQRNGQPTVSRKKEPGSYGCEGVAGTRPELTEVCLPSVGSHCMCAWDTVHSQHCHAHLDAHTSLGGHIQLEAEPQLPHGSLAEPPPMAGCVWVSRRVEAKFKGLRGMWTEREATEQWLAPRLEPLAASGQSETERSPRKNATEANHACSHCQGKGPVGQNPGLCPHHILSRGNSHKHLVWFPSILWHAQPHTQADFHILRSPILGTFFCSNRYFKKQNFLKQYIS